MSETITFVGRDGNRLLADRFGDPTAPVVLLQHGGGQTRYSWHGTARSIAAAGMCAISLDLRGHGESEWVADGDYGFESFGADAAVVTEQIGPPVAMVGASLGGIASLLVAGELAPDAASCVVLVDVVARIEPAGADRIKDFMMGKPEGFASLEEAADAVAAYNPHRRRPTSVVGLQKNLRQREGRWFWHWDPAFIGGKVGLDREEQQQRLGAAARALKVPAMLVRGRQSDIVSEEGAREFLEQAPHAEFVDVRDAGHMVAGDQNDVFTDAVLGFLRRSIG